MKRENLPDPKTGIGKKKGMNFSKHFGIRSERKDQRFVSKMGQAHLALQLMGE